MLRDYLLVGLGMALATLLILRTSKELSDDAGPWVIIVTTVIVWLFWPIITVYSLVKE